MQASIEPRQVAIQTEFDIVNLRHTVRQMTRLAGLDLTRQAKVTVAISALARAFLNTDNEVRFTIQVLPQRATSTQQQHAALEITCVSKNTQAARNAEHLESMFGLHEIRLLVDEFHIDLTETLARLTLCVWLHD
jgi:anti-sigma regulatory factor (Ser/Thr protein kinase)